MVALLNDLLRNYSSLCGSAKSKFKSVFIDKSYSRKMTTKPLLMILTSYISSRACCHLAPEISLTGEVRMHTANANLDLIDPSSPNPHLGKKQFSEIRTWATKLYVCEYGCIYFPNGKNVRAPI